MATKPGVPEFWSGKSEELARKSAQVTNQLQKGQGNNSFKTRLRTTPETTTEILVSFARPNHMAVFSAQDSASAVEIAAGTIWAVVSQGKVTINHGASASEREVGVVLFG
jgi:hypothetical protein